MPAKPLAFTLTDLPGWSNLPVRGGTSERPDSMGWENPGRSDAREAFLNSLGASLDGLVLPWQVHGTRVVRVAAEDRGRGAQERANALPETDALLTDASSVALGVLTADCFPLFFCDPSHGAVAIAHAGWKGTAAGIASKMVGVLGKTFDTDPGEVRVAIGPGIRACCYEVQSDVAAQFPSFISVRDGKFFLDLIDANRRQFLESGILPERISDGGFCTRCEGERFFSHRREGPAAGRMLSVIALSS